MNLIVSDEEYKKRLDICKGCEFLTMPFGVEQCNKCGCFMNVKAKFSQASCPIDKWSPLK